MAKDVIEILDRLIETCHDTEHAFLAAADAVPDASIKRLFTAYAAQRARFASEIERERRRLEGAAARHASSADGAPHPAWTDRSAALARLDEDAVLAETERGAWIARRVYEEALNVGGLPADVRRMITRQSERVAQTHDALQGLITWGARDAPPKPPALRAAS
jgi:uncharacterized protein (TIGR02284 family)